MENTNKKDREKFERRWEKTKEAVGEREILLSDEQRNQELLRLAAQRGASAQGHPFPDTEAPKKSKSRSDLLILHKKVVDSLDPHEWRDEAWLLDKVGVDLKARTDVAELLEGNSSVEVQTGSDGGLKYRRKVEYRVADKEELRKLINSPDRIEGLEYTTLEECYENANFDLDELIESEEVFAIFSEDGNKTVCFPRDKKEEVPEAREFRDLWTSTSVGDDHDVRKLLKAAGYTPASRPHKSVPKPKAARKRNARRQTNFVNDHIDIEQDD